MVLILKKIFVALVKIEKKINDFKLKLKPVVLKY